jgi:hypothetical protein
VVKAIELTYPGIRRENIHVWTLRGKGRDQRIGGLWQQWEEQGVHLVDDGWMLPTGVPAFTESGTYAPTYLIGTWRDDDLAQHLFLCDGYAASAEAMQAASLAPMLDLDASLAIFTSKFGLPHEKEQYVMGLDPDGDDFRASLEELVGQPLSGEDVKRFAAMIEEAREAGMNLRQATINADDFFPEKRWGVIAVSGYMGLDPYTGAPGVEEVKPGVYRVTVRLAAPRGDKRITFTLRLMESMDESWLVFNPLLNRFLAGEDYLKRAVKISDSGRIRNELQTLCIEALEFLKDEHIRVHFNRIPPEVISIEKQKKLLEVLRWYKERHPLWFSWLDLASTGELE